MTINISIPNSGETPELRPRITVFGVGGAGGNGVNNMIQSQLEGVDFVVANTDAQALSQSRTDRRIQLGADMTRGLGAGSRPDVGAAAAEESIDEIMEHLRGCNMVFITAGMGGGTGTGAAPVIARAAREVGVLTVGVVTKPFHFEGSHRMRVAEAGIADMEQYVDTLIIIPNQNLFRVANEKTTFADAFSMADDVLYSGVRGVTDLMVMPGLINLDFADIRAVMSEMGKAMMGTGEAEGERRALDAAEAAIANPLLDDTTMSGATGVLINITGGKDMTLFEVDEAANRIRSEVDPEAHIIFGSTFDESLDGRMRVSIVATGMDAEAKQEPIRTAPKLAVMRPASVLPTEIAAAQTAAMVVEMRPTVQEMPESLSQPVARTIVQAVAEDESETTMMEAPEEVQEAATPVSATPASTKPAPTEARAAYIPPEPVEPGRNSRLAADPFAAAAMANGSAPRRDASETAGSTPAKAPSLFERVTGTGRAAWAGRTRRQSSEPAQSDRTEPAASTGREPHEAPVAKPAVQPRAVAPRMTEPAPLKETPQAQLGGLSPSDRIVTSTPEEDLLDIPAFLRRQAN